MNDFYSNILKLKSSDEKIIEIDENGLKRANFFNKLKDILNLNEEIPIKNVDCKTLNKIVDYLKHYQNEEPNIIPKPLPSPDLKPILSEWDYNYITPISLGESIDLVNAADYLGIRDLVNLASARLASEMINCPIEEARRKFGIVPDMTEEEMAEYDKYPLD